MKNDANVIFEVNITLKKQKTSEHARIVTIARIFPIKTISEQVSTFEFFQSILSLINCNKTL